MLQPPGSCVPLAAAAAALLHLWFRRGLFAAEPSEDSEATVCGRDT